MCSRRSGSHRSPKLVALMCAGAAIAAVIAPRPVDAAVSRSFAPSFSVIALVAPPVDPTLMPTVASETTEPAASELSDPVTGDIDPSTVASDVGLPSTTIPASSALPETGSGGHIDPSTVATDVGLPSATTPWVLPDTGSGGDIDPSTVASDAGVPRATSHPHSLLPATGSDPLDRMMAVAVLLLLTGVLALGVAHGRRRSIA